MISQFNQPRGSTSVEVNKQSIARNFGVKEDEVVYFSSGIDLSGFKVIYDESTQRAYSLPSGIVSGTTAISLNEQAILTHSAGSVDLGELAVSREEYVTLPGSFNFGHTINVKNELLVHDDKKYRWDGTLPKVVPVGSTPETTGGVGLGAWVSVGDASLRSDLSEEGGINIVGGADVYTYVANGTNDGAGLTAADAVAVSLRRRLKIAGVAKVTSPITLNADIANGRYQIFTSDSQVSLANSVSRASWFNSIQAAVNSVDGLIAPTVEIDGTFSVTTVIQPTLAIRFIGIGPAKINFTGNYALVPFSGSSVENITFEGVSTGVAMTTNLGTDGLNIINCHAITCGLLITNYLTVDPNEYVNMTDAKLSKNIKVVNCTGSAPGSDKAFFVSFRYAKDCLLSGGKSEGYLSGFNWWGGDSDFTKDGTDKTKPRWCKNILVKNFNSSNATLSGIWGSFGVDILIINSRSTRDTFGGDVGIDFEGCFRSKAIGCYSEGWANGNYAVFFGIDSILFSGCTSRQSGNNPHFRTSNSSNDPTKSGDVSIDSCLFSGEVLGNSMPVVDAQLGTARSISITNCQFVNSRVDLSALNQATVNISGNVFNFDTSAAPTIVTYVRPGLGYTCTISNNKMDYASIVDSGTKFITVETMDGNLSSLCVINGNHGPKLIEVKETGYNAGISGRYQVYDNNCLSLLRSDSGAKALVLTRTDNNFQYETSAVLSFN